MREKLSYPVRIIISLLSIFLWSFPAEGQDSESLKKQLDQKLNSFARQYVSSRTIKIDSILMQKKKVTLFANEALEDIPFREYNVSELYASIAPLFPNASKIVILTRGTDIESLIPEYDRKGRPNKKRLYSIKESKYPLTRSLSSPHEIKTDTNRHIALWQSHDTGAVLSLCTGPPRRCIGTSRPFFPARNRRGGSYCQSSEAERDYSAIADAPSFQMQGQCMYCNHCQPCPSGIDVAAVTSTWISPGSMRQNTGRHS